jgi:DNA-binding transcriptional regulator YhcF (GntR family)
MAELLPLSPVPLYTQLKELLRERILDGSYPPHSRMPSESELGKAFDVSRITVRQALGDLQKEGLIFKIHGKGTFVAKPKAFQNVSTLQGLAESMTQMGYEVLNRLRSFRHVPASALVAQRLQVEEGSLVTEIRQVRLINREPVSLEITYLPKASASAGEGRPGHPRHLPDAGKRLRPRPRPCRSGHRRGAGRQRPDPGAERGRGLADHAHRAPDPHADGARWTSNTFTTVAMRSSTACGSTARRGQA